jgi:hypothetical protein
LPWNRRRRVRDNRSIAVATVNITIIALHCHRNIATTQKYTHLRPIHEVPAHERLVNAMPISDLVMVPRKRAAGKGTLKEGLRQRVEQEAVRAF